MGLSEVQRKANDKYIASHYQRLPISYDKAFCSLVYEAAAKANQSLAGYIKEAILQRMRSDGVYPGENVSPVSAASTQAENTKDIPNK